MFDIQDYYLGVIIPQIDYYKNSRRNRFIGDVSFDPFSDIPPVLALMFGTITLLYKNGENYYDQYFSRYENELYYRLDEANELGIILTFVGPFQKYYTESPVFYNQEDIDKDYYQLAEISEMHSYYIAHSKLKKTDVIVTLDDNPLEYVKRDYLDILYQKNGMQYCKK